MDKWLELEDIVFKTLMHVWMNAEAIDEDELNKIAQSITKEYKSALPLEV